MISEQYQAILEKSNLGLERISFSSSSGQVVVGVSDTAGNRFLGRAAKNGNPFASLRDAFESALDQFDPTWRQIE